MPPEPGWIATEFTSEKPYGAGWKPALAASSTSTKPVPLVEPLNSPALEATKTLPCPSNWMFPIVWLFCPGSKIGRAVDHVLPPSVVLENQVGPRNAWALSAASGLWLGAFSRSQGE